MSTDPKFPVEEPDGDSCQSERKAKASGETTSGIPEPASEDNRQRKFEASLPTISVPLATSGAENDLLLERYKLIEPIGEGGMGTVWRAQQVKPVRREVAVKLIKPGMDSKSVLARFDAERQALAIMDYPNIARVLDGGMTDDGRPYFVMELVRGLPLTEYCDQKRLTIQQRLELFAQICSAVQHAHQKGIIHRDLKPSNILVTEVDGKPVPKVIDFGLAKALGSSTVLTEHTLHTGFGMLLGTPLYMAPEQMDAGALDIDTRADIYSLGVILYELLTGSTPFDRQKFKNAALDEIKRIVREEEPLKPSSRLSSIDTLPSVAATRQSEPISLHRLVRGELDWIVMKSLDKDRNRRYDTANALSADVQRYLTGEPVTAAPPSRLYRFRKSIRKNRGPVIAAMLVMFTFSLGMAGIGWFAISEYRARTAAEQARKLAAENFARASENLDSAEEQLARSHYLMAHSRLKNSEWGKARELFHQIPRKRRNLEWYLDSQFFEGNNITLYYHQDEIASISFSPDDKYVVSGDRLGTIKIWEAASGKELHSKKGHSWNVSAIAFHPEGKEFVSGGTDKKLKLWDLATCSELKQLIGHSDRISSLCYTADGTMIISGSDDMTLKIWDQETGQLKQTLEGHKSSILCVNCSADNTHITSFAKDKNLKLWNFNTGNQLQSQGIAANDLVTACFSSNGASLITVGQEISMWDISHGNLIRTFSVPGEGCPNYQCINVSGDGKRLAAGTTSYPDQESALVVTWDMESGQLLQLLKGHSGADVSCVGFSSDSSRVAAGNARSWEANQIKIWDVANKGMLRTFEGDLQGASCFDISPSGEHLVTGDKDGSIKVWSIESGSLLLKLSGHSEEITCVKYSPDGIQIVSGSLDNTLILYNAESGLKQNVMTEHTSQVKCLSYSPDGKSLVSGDSGGTIKHWDSRSARLLGNFQGHYKEVELVEFHPDGKQLISASHDLTIRVWDILTRENTLTKQVGGALAICCSPNGDRLLYSTYSYLTCLDLKSDKILWTSSAIDGGISYLDFSPDGTRIVTTSYNDTAVNILDAETGELLRILEGVSGRLRWAPDGSIAILHSDSLILWDCPTGHELVAIVEHSDMVSALSFSPDGSRFVSGGMRGTLKLWDFQTRQELHAGQADLHQIQSLSFSADGSKISVFQEKEMIWDPYANSALPLTAGEWGGFSSLVSSDGRWLLIPMLSKVGIIDLDFKDSQDEKIRRQRQSRIKSPWHMEQSSSAEQSENWFAATFHRAWILKARPDDLNAYDNLHRSYGELLKQDESNSHELAALLPPAVKEALALPRPIDSTDGDAAE